MTSETSVVQSLRLPDSPKRVALKGVRGKGRVKGEEEEGIRDGESF